MAESFMDAFDAIFHSPERGLVVPLGGHVYEVTIRRTRTIRAKLGNDWTKVGEEDGGKAVYGYTPEYEGDKVVTEDILTQRVEDLDVAAVIAVINGLPMREKAIGAREAVPHRGP